MSQNTHYTIRDAVPADAEKIIDMHARSWLDTYPNSAVGVTKEWVEERVADWHTAERIQKRREYIRQAAQSQDMFYKVALNEQGDIIGMACPVRDVESQHVGGLYVARGYHGTGVAQGLMQEIIAWADPTRPLELEAASYNERAKRFYEKNGFREIPGSEARHSDTIPTLKMIRKGDKQ
jgi:GNAT superfamily N-acetyltransferase